MPTEITKRGKRRILAAVQIDKKRYQKLFPDVSRTSFAAAITWEDQTKKEVIANKGRVVTLQIWRDTYLDYAKTRYLPKTYKAKRDAFDRLGKYIDTACLVSSLDVSDCLRYLTDQAKKRSGNAANRDRKEFGTAYEFGRLYLGLPPDNPWRQVDKFPEKKYSRYGPPMSDFEKVMKVASGQDRVMLIALLHLAARKSELFGLKWEDIDHENERIRLYTRKRKGGNHEHDWLPATAILLAVLKRWKKTRDKMKLPGKDPAADLVFLSRSTGRRYKNRVDILNRLCRAAGVRRFTFHAVRHLTAMTLYKSGATTQHIQLVLRHLDPRTTSKYLRRIGVEDVRETLEDNLK